jgi:hypothetical protein
MPTPDERDPSTPDGYPPLTPPRRESPPGCLILLSILAVLFAAVLVGWVG